jgi:NhaP-type Na+/H+ or K+/H+ antiporter
VQGWVEGQHQGPGKAIRIFVQLSFGGSGMGLAVGFAVTILLRTMFENPDAEVGRSARRKVEEVFHHMRWLSSTCVAYLPVRSGRSPSREGSTSDPPPEADRAGAQITLTILAAYGAYTISDELLDLSGVLACVALGLWVAAKGRHRISSAVVGPMHTVWCAFWKSAALASRTPQR